VATNRQISQSALLAEFRSGLQQADVISDLRRGLIGHDVEIPGLNGSHRLVYADYVASGRALHHVEDFILKRILPYYANSHTEASYCGAYMTQAREGARTAIAKLCNANEQHAVIFCGSGATAGINRLVNLLGVSKAAASGQGATVFVGPYEHHSNILPWLESGAEIVELPESAEGGPDRAVLAAALRDADQSKLTVCAFSAASNVTGIISDVAGITKQVKDAGGLMVWDYAGAGPYLPIDMSAGMDAVVVSPHKFVGGPGASGVLIARRDAVTARKPTWAGGGTVKFVSSWALDYSDSLEAREEAGTPNVVGDIRAALAFLVKDAIGDDYMRSRNDWLSDVAAKRLRSEANIELLGSESAMRRLPIFSFCVRNVSGGHIHQQLVTRMLSDQYGIQARGGCACAGPYVHRLLGIDEARSQSIRTLIRDGHELEKPGLTRFNLSVLLTDDEVDYILSSISELAQIAPQLIDRYDVDESRAIFHPKRAV